MKEAFAGIGRRTRWALAGLAAVWTLSNAFKPLHIDDTFTGWIAAQIARFPLNPYGLEIFWTQWPQIASENLTPPVLPYWTAIAVRFFGENEFVWKLWLFPFCLLLVFSLHRILLFFGARPALPFVALIVLAPTHLPALNLMQDVPAQSLGLTALALYLVAQERRSWPLALGAAVVAALAAQTKYTQVAVVGVMLAHALLFARLRFAILIAVVSGGLFLSWEGIMGRLYGEGMLAGQLGMELFWYKREAMLVPLLRMAGATLPMVGLLCLLALRVPREVALALGALTLSGFAALIFVPIETPLFVSLGVLVLGALALLALRGIRLGTASGVTGPASGPRGDGLLVLWIVIELGFYFGVAPFPAVRRIMGLTIVGVFLAARHLGPLDARTKRTAMALVVAGCLLGCLYGVVDFQEARAQRDGVRLAESVIRADEPNPRIWFVGHWGFQHHAERLGMQPVVPDASRLSDGDWLLLPTDIHRQEVEIESSPLEHVGTLSIPARLPLATGGGYYGGFTPLSHRDGARFEIAILRVRRDFLARSAWSARRLYEWTEITTGRTAAAALPALVEFLDDPVAADREWAARGLGNLGPSGRPAADALRPLLDDEDSIVREAASAALESIGPAPLN